MSSAPGISLACCLVPVERGRQAYSHDDNGVCRLEQRIASLLVSKQRDCKQRD